MITIFFSLERRQINDKNKIKKVGFGVSKDCFWTRQEFDREQMSGVRVGLVLM